MTTVQSITLQRLEEYIRYHTAMMEAGDTDPQNPMLRYLCERFELNIEQRLWLAFLTATCYCAPTVFYIYNEFPDYENIDFDRMERWWSVNRNRTVFQTDCQWIRSRNQFVDVCRSYRSLIGDGRTQAEAFQELMEGKSPEESYNSLYERFQNVQYFGRFRMFLYLEAVYVTTDYSIRPTTLNMRDAESSRNGLAFALGRDDLMNHFHKRQPTSEQFIWLEKKFQLLQEKVSSLRPQDTSVWSLETTLCAYKKYKLKKRWVGYYIERQRREIEKLEKNVPTGVCWDVLWEFRQEYFRNDLLRELSSNFRDHKYSQYWSLDE